MNKHETMGKENVRKMQEGKNPEHSEDNDPICTYFPLALRLVN